jgi:hypothetical protein
MEGERDGVSRRGGLNERHINTWVDIMIGWLTYDVRGIIEETCSVVADIDIMGHRVVRVVPGGRGGGGGGGSEQRHSAEQCERGEDHGWYFVKNRVVE